MLIIEYIQTFDELKTRSQTLEDPDKHLRYLNLDWGTTLEGNYFDHPYLTWNKPFKFFWDLDEYIESFKKLDTTLNCSTKITANQPYYLPTKCKPSTFNVVDFKGNDNKCFKCVQHGHMAYQCPKKNLHIGMEHVEEPNQQKEEDDENYDYDICSGGKLLKGPQNLVVI